LHESVHGITSSLIGLPEGEKADVISLQKVAKTVMSWKDIHKEEMDKMVGTLGQKRLFIKKGICMKLLSQLQMVCQVHKHIDEEVSSAKSGLLH